MKRFYYVFLVQLVIFFCLPKQVSKQVLKHSFIAKALLYQAFDDSLQQISQQIDKSMLE
mgnify:CR=1 FL=1|jgi:hypothetical protein